MKYLRGLAAGMLIMLSVFIMLYLTVTYMKFKPDEDILAEVSKLEQFIDKSHFNRDYLRIVFAFSISAVAGILFKNRPELSLSATALSLAFVLQLYDYSLLTKRPMVICILCFCSVALQIAVCRAFDRKTGSRSLFRAGILTSASALVISVFSNIFEYRVYSVRKMLTELSDNGITLVPRIKAIPEFVGMIYQSYLTKGVDTARDLLYLFQKQTSSEFMENHFLSSLSEEDFPFAAVLSLLIALSIAAFVLLSLKKHPAAAAASSAVPVIYAFVILQSDRLNTLALPVVLLVTLSFVCIYSDRIPVTAGAAEGYYSFDDTIYDGDESDVSYDGPYLGPTADATQAAQTAETGSETGSASDEAEEIYYT